MKFSPLELAVLGLCGLLVVFLVCVAGYLALQGMGLLRTPTPISRAAPVELVTATEIIWKTLAPHATSTRAPPATLEPKTTRYGFRPCDCAGPDLDCPDFAGHSAAQECFNFCNAAGNGDLFRLDRDKDGIACQED
jgi:hypothetical protein